MLLFPAIASVLFYFAFKNYLNTRKHGYGVQVDTAKNRLIALLVSFAMFGLLYFLLFYLATTGIFGGLLGGSRALLM